jgi:hypothetical protein
VRFVKRPLSNGETLGGRWGGRSRDSKLCAEVRDGAGLILLDLPLHGREGRQGVECRRAATSEGDL